MLVKVRATGSNREEMKRLADIFRARVVEVTARTYVLEATGDRQKLDAFLNVLGRSNIVETARTGACGLSRGDAGMG